MFSSKIFIVSGLMFRSLIHFEFIFVYGVSKCSSFILLQVLNQFSQHHVFSALYILASFVKDKVSICAWIYLWAFYFVPLIYIFVFVPVPYCLDDCGGGFYIPGDIVCVLYMYVYIYISQVVQW